MTVLSVLKCGGSAVGLGLGALGLPSGARITITPIRIIGHGLGKSSNLNQLTKQNGVLSIRQFNSTGGKGQGQPGDPSGIRVAEFIKHPNFRQFKVTPSRYSWAKYKDMFHFYFLLGFIPCMTIVFLVNVFIGPPTLAIPEPGYVPKPWEYQRHPITQFMCKYIFPSYQQVYERNLFYLREEDEKRRMRLIAWKAERLMRERGDFYNYWGTKTIFPKYNRQVMEQNRRVMVGMGDPIDDESAIGLPLDR